MVARIVEGLLTSWEFIAVLLGFLVIIPIIFKLASLDRGRTEKRKIILKDNSEDEGIEP